MVDTMGLTEVNRDVLARMNDAQWHRGPDEGSLHIEPGVGLGHRRLSIIDIATGQQPLFNEDGSVAVVFNGEIYNYQDLVIELQALGHVFHTKSDTEVIVHAWESWGADCVKRFRGMIAFALWDRNQQTFFMARDRLGVKPLYYALLDNGMLLFGSELKSILAHGGLHRDILLLVMLLNLAPFSSRRVNFRLPTPSQSGVVTLSGSPWLIGMFGSAWTTPSRRQMLRLSWSSVYRSLFAFAWWPRYPWVLFCQVALTAVPWWP